MLTVFFGMGGVVQATGDVTLSVESSVDELTTGGSVSFTAEIYNDTEEILTGYSVNYGDKKLKGSSNSLASGDVATLSFKMDVTDAMLDQPITFSVKYTTATIPEATVGGSDSVTIAKKELVTDLRASCSVSQTIVNAGDVIKFTYKLENLGETTLSNILLKAEGIGSSALNKDALTLKPGKSTEFTYEHTVKTVTTITPYIEYAADGVAQEEKSLEPIELTSEERKVEPVLSVDNPNPEPGETVTFTLTITNEGTVPYTNLTVAYGGQDIGFSSSRLNPGDEKSETYEMTFATSTDVKFQVTLKDHEGETVSVGSNTVSIELPVDPDALQQKLDLVIAPDVSQLTAAGTINFSGYIANNSDYILSSVTLSESTLGNIPGVSDTMEAGSRTNLTFSADISETTTYNFVLTVHDRNGDEYTVTADPITVTVASVVVATPGYDDAAVVDEEELTLEPNSGGVGKLGTFAIIAIVLVILILGVGVTLLVLWRKGKRPKKRSAVPVRKGVPAMSKTKNTKGPKNYRDRNNF